jgi:photosystem II stability/assembly factor-like uncharacterized protein
VNTGTAVGYENPDGTILRTTDGGNTWLRQSSGLSDPFDGINFFGVYFVNSNVGTVVGEEGIILRTTDGGNNWVPQASDTTDWLYGVHFTDEITEQSLVFSMARSFGRLTVGRAGFRNPLAKPRVCLEFISPIPTTAQPLVMTA